MAESEDERQLREGLEGASAREPGPEPREIGFLVADVFGAEVRSTYCDEKGDLRTPRWNEADVRIRVDTAWHPRREVERFIEKLTAARVGVERCRVQRSGSTESYRLLVTMHLKRTTQRPPARTEPLVVGGQRASSTSQTTCSSCGCAHVIRAGSKAYPGEEREWGEVECFRCAEAVFAISYYGGYSVELA